MDFRVNEQFAEVFEFEGALDWMTHHLNQLFVGTKNLMSFFVNLKSNLQYHLHCPCQRTSPFSAQPPID